ncbi:glycosyltransferase family 28 domain-containing protein [Echria macrotheca]|uniref:Glycosyltransferase family 28 domain-containing protein n=1 Tax=Echria macrotheca TaxID=438768 RepID=A0AAJ0BDA1_9PEZI|nr:glycosyltransferase family 28 domain-containing protein [Echria macrotheca]
MSNQEPLVSRAPTSGSTDTANDVPLHLQTTSHHGHEVTVVRDDNGHVVYPSYVPPSTKSPASPDSTSSLPPPAPRSGPSNGNIPSPGTQPRKSNSEPMKSPSSQSRPGVTMAGHQSTANTKEAKARVGRQRAFTLPHPVRRTGTGVSDLNEALHNATDYTSSSDSSDEERDNEAGRKHRHSDDRYGRFRIGNSHYHTRGKVSKRDGRLNISLKDTSNTGYLAKALGTAARKVVPVKKMEADGEGPRNYRTSRVSSASTVAGPDTISCPKLNIVIMVIGSRGDAQPFLKVGKVLKEQYGHRVRIATHPAFREFVEKDSGLEFFSVGGDPSELMAFMVKNPGMIPTLESVKAGDIGRRRAAMAEMFEGFWRACINATDDEKDIRNVKMMGEKDPFVADAIIANPPSFAHIHCAEALGIPLHLMFTFPYTPTQAFPHPLASIKKSNVDPGYTNWISYPLVEMMVWQGLGDLVNDFRVNTLGLDPVSTLWAPGATYRLHVPFTYLWSPALVPKPEDWGEEIDVSGFVFLDLASTFKPPSPLTKFLDAGETPIYIGFGSIVVDDANRFTEMIFEAVKLAGVRALVSKGWGGLGGDSLDVPDNIFLLDNTPHDWLFPKVRACVIHGGAGTTAIALKCGKPTMVVPFFGDQHFWGSMLGTSGAGPEAVPYKNLTAENLAEGIKYCLTEKAREAAEKLSKEIAHEGDGAENACRAFHKHLALSGKNSMRCSILEDRVAVWQLKNTNLRISAMAANYIVDRGYVSWKKLRLLRHNEWNDFEGPGEPITGVAGTLMSTAGNVFGGVGGVPYRIAKSKQQRKEKKQKRREKAAKRREEKEKKKNEKNQSRDQSRRGSSAPPPTTDAVDHADPPESDDEISPEDIQTTTSNAIRRRDTQMTASTAEPENPAEEFVHQVGRGAYKSASALAKAPVDLSVALVQGFHNAPRLYGDDTVRRPTRVTGIKSGLRAARHEFVYGIYDGFTGLVRLPVRGARDGGVRGFVVGIGMGVTGFVLKDIAALIGPVGYTLKGIVKQAERGRQPIKYIRRARIVQGEREVECISEEERKARAEQVERGWEVMRALWDALEAEEKKKGGLKGRFGARKRSRRGLGAAFESVETAEKALGALRRGEGVESVIGGDKGREDEDEGKSSPEAVKEEEEKGNGNEKGKKVVFEGDGARSELVPGLGEFSDGADTPVEERENPFAPHQREVTKNKEENRRVMEAVGV